MIPCLSHTELVLLHAQLAFIRGERAAQWRTPRSFRSFDGRPTLRQQRLTELCDAVGDALLTIVRSHPDMQRLAARQQVVAVRTVEHVTERCARFGCGVLATDVDCIEASIRRQLHETGSPTDTMWSAAGTRLLVPVGRGAEPLLWPAALPPSLIADAVGADQPNPAEV